MTDRCDTCRFFAAMPDSQVDGIDGMCRRLPPVAARPAFEFIPTISVLSSGFPAVRAGLWCGEFEPQPATPAPGCLDGAGS